MIVKSIGEEYWTTQYLARVSGHREPIFWPPDGENKYDTLDAARANCDELLDRYAGARVVHVVRTMEFGEPITKEKTT